MDIQDVKDLTEKYSESWSKFCRELICGSYFYDGLITPDDSYDYEVEVYNEDTNTIEHVKVNIVEEINKLGYTIKSEDGYGGEGRGDNYWGVFSLTKGNKTVYIKLSGYYASYHGSDVDYDDWNEVIPSTKTIKCWKDA